MGEFLWWLIVAAVFVAAEFGHRAFYALFIALGAIVAAVLAIAGVPVIVQLPAFVAAAVAGLLLIRPSLARAMSSGQYRFVSGIRGHIGQEAVVAETVAGMIAPGRIRLNGELWKAVSQGGEAIEPGKVVLILDLQGTTFVVEEMPSLDSGPMQLPDSS